MADMAKMAYRPIGLAASLGSAALAGKLVAAVWKKVAHEDDTPGAMDPQYSMGKVIAFALFQAGVFAIIQVLVDRGGARLFEKVTGSWPGD